jgi:hypothetical protein
MIKFIVETLKFCKENNLRGKNIDIALGKYKTPETFKELTKHFKTHYGTKKDS